MVCVHMRTCMVLLLVFTAHTCLYLLLQEMCMHNYVTSSSQFICIFLNQRITAWLILSNVDVCYVCCRDSNQITNCTHSFNNVYRECGVCTYNLLLLLRKVCTQYTLYRMVCVHMHTCMVLLLVFTTHTCFSLTSRNVYA